MVAKNSQPVDFKAILRGIWRRHKALVVSVFLVVLIPGMAVVYFTSRPSYVSTATIAIESSGLESIPFFKEIPRKDNIATHQALLNSRSLGEGVIEALPRESFQELLTQSEHRDYLLILGNLIKKLRGDPPTILSPQQQALAELQKARMEFKQSREAPGIFTISGTASSPRVAMDLVNTYIQVLLSRTRSSNQDEAQKARMFLEGQVQQLRENLSQAEDALVKYQQQKGRISLGSQTELDLMKLSQNENALAEAQASREVIAARIAFLRKSIEESRPRATASTPAADHETQPPGGSPAPLAPAQEAKLAAFKTAQDRLARLEAKLAGLRERYTDAHPLIQVTQEEVAREQATVAQLARDLPSLPPPRGATPQRAAQPPVETDRNEAMRQLAALEIEEAAIKARVDTLRLQTDRMRSSLRNLSQEEIGFNNLRRTVESQRNLLTVMNDRLMAARIREQGEGGVVKIIDPASFPLQASSTKTQKTLLIVLGLAVALAVGPAVGIEYWRQPVETEDDVKAAVTLPVLGSVSSFDNKGAPRRGGKASSTAPSPVQLVGSTVGTRICTELYRAIRANIEAERLKRPFRSLLITSPAPNEGKSTTAINLGQVFQEFGRRVLVVDADLRRPAIHKSLAISNSPGLIDLLKGSASLDQAMRRMPSGLAVIPGQVTKEDPAALLASPQFAEIMNALTAELFDLILVDSAPVLAVPDNLLLAPAVDRVLLVAKASSTSKRDLARATRTLEQVSAKVLGVVLNEANPVDVHYYHPRYRKYYTPTPSDTPPPKPSAPKRRLFAWKDKGKGV